jgi:membrane associated rhomboid family serine protease
VTASHQVWRLFTSLLLTESLGECAVSGFLLYTFRLFERQLGSSKFAVFLLLASAVAVAARGALVALVPETAMHGLASGPYHIIFGLLPLYLTRVPSLVPATLLSAASGSATRPSSTPSRCSSCSPGGCGAPSPRSPASSSARSTLSTRRA